MAKVCVALVQLAEGMKEVIRSAPITSELITSSGTSQLSTTAAGSGEYWMVSTTGDIWIKFGSAATAAAGDDYLLPAGSIYHVKATLGDKCAVIDA